MRRMAWPGWVGVGILSASVALAQDYSVLRINEVIAENDTRFPKDVGGSYVDMVEIFNTGDVAIDIGFSNPNQSLALSDSLELPPPTVLWTFRDRDRILAGDSLIVFLDANDVQNGCEPHANFNLASDGSEPITLWAPMQDGQRAIIDQVWLPPLPADVSFGRSPDGAGPAPVPLEAVLDTFVFFPPGESTLGSCIPLADSCGDGNRKQLCRGRPNGSGGNIAPRVERLTFSTNSPTADAPVFFTARVEDEKEPLPGNITSVEIVYRVNGGPETVAPMAHDGGPVIHDVITDDTGQVIGENPFNVWTIWEGSIPGQPQGSVVDFFFRVTDAEGLVDTSPEMLCPDGVGPCHREFGGPNCTVDALDVTCANDPVNPDVVGARYIECRKRFQYTVEYTPPGALANVVINEVLASHDGIYLDVTERPCNQDDSCPSDRLDCCKYRNDLIEILNTGTEAVDLSGLWLSSSPFGPEAWQFPPGSVIPPEGPSTSPYIRVWLDNDGKKCPNPDLPPDDRPCFWECPDPTNPGMSEYHANFALAAEGDQIYLFDSAAANFGVIHGVAFGPQELNQSLSLVPNGSRQGSWLQTTPTILLPNASVESLFRRGDSDGNCGVDITDGIFILNYLFLGTTAPSDPGPDVSGPDPTPDGLVDCVSSTC